MQTIIALLNYLSKKPSVAMAHWKKDVEAAHLVLGAVGIIKKAMNQIGGQPLELSTDVGINYQFAASRTTDHAEAVKAFLEKRRPSFIGD